MRSQWAIAAAVAAAVGLAKATPLVAVELPPKTVSASTVPATDSPEMAWWRQSMQTRDQRLGWWRQARFGMFIHWGVYSELGGEWQGKPVAGYAEHIMRKCKIPLAVYKDQAAGQFNPTKFDASKWVELAKQAGMGYVVITSKHHDGFAMFDSDVSDYNVVKATPWHHDPMKDLKHACEEQGLHLGFYYSQAWDWADANGTGNDWDFDNPAGDRNLHGGKEWWNASPEWVPRVQKYVDGKAIPQLRELITKYHPDLIWFDTNGKMPPALNLEVLKATRAAGLDVIINSRCVAKLGDYSSTTDRPAEFSPHEGDWEGIPTTNESYGYHKSDHSHKPPEHFIPLIAKAVARGGNLMLNVGPRGDGTIDPADVAILRGIGNWMKVNGESIHGAGRTLLAVQAWGESTRKGDVIYLHVFNWPSDGKLVIGGLKSEIAGAYLLADAGKSPLKFDRVSDLDVQLAVPTTAVDAADTVIAVECRGEIVADSTRLLSPTQPNALRVFDGQLTGKTIKFGQGKKENAFVEQWSDPKDSVSWTVRVAAPTSFKVSSLYDAAAGSAGGEYQVTIDKATFAGAVHEGKNRSDELGTTDLSPGVHTISATPKQIVGQELMNLRTVTLTAVGHETTSSR